MAPLPLPRDLTRRGFLALSAAGAVAACGTGEGAAPVTTTTAPDVPVPDLTSDPFTLGVASGDPSADSVVLWTRLAPDPTAGGGMPDAEAAVRWEIAADEAFDAVVASGWAVTRSAAGHAVHVDPGGLTSDTWYWYRFTIGPWSSPTGRTRTLPDPGDDPGALSFAFASCQAYQSGWYAAHRHLAAEEIDLVLFLGDYIYEGGPDESAPRQHEGPEPTDLVAYRNRYGTYKSDADLQAAHAAFPWIVTWDDHEVENNYAGDVDENGSPPDEFLARRRDAYRAWYEHMPVRLPEPTGDSWPIHRAFEWGDLARLVVLDTRQYRTDQQCGGEFGAICAEAEDEAATMLGDEQRAWLEEQLVGSDRPWTVLAQQTVMTPLRFGPVVNLDQWDGYPTERLRVLDMMQRATTNTVVITGDIHASGVGDLRLDPDEDGSPIVGTELVGTSISSEFPADLAAAVGGLVSAMADVHYADFEQRGYVLCEVSHDGYFADYRYVSDAGDPDATVTTGSSWQIAVGAAGAFPA